MKRQLKIISKKEKGFSLVEVLVAIAVLGAFGAALMSCLAAGLKVLSTTDIQDTARDLAEAQMENIQTQPYDEINDPPVYPLVASIPSGYAVTLTINRLDRGDNTTQDTGIQHITITITQGTDVVFTLEGQKVKW